MTTLHMSFLVRQRHETKYYEPLNLRHRVEAKKRTSGAIIDHTTETMATGLAAHVTWRPNTILADGKERTV